MVPHKSLKYKELPTHFRFVSHLHIVKQRLYAYWRFTSQVFTAIRPLLLYMFILQNGANMINLLCLKLVQILSSSHRILVYQEEKRTGIYVRPSLLKEL